jgi:hypothetical protein
VDSFAFVHIIGHPSSISEVLVICIFYILRRIGFLCKNRFKAPVGTRSRGTWIRVFDRLWRSTNIRSQRASSWVITVSFSKECNSQNLLTICSRAGSTKWHEPFFLLNARGLVFWRASLLLIVEVTASWTNLISYDLKTHVLYK